MGGACKTCSGCGGVMAAAPHGPTRFGASETPAGGAVDIQLLHIAAVHGWLVSRLSASAGAGWLCWDPQNAGPARWLCCVPQMGCAAVSAEPICASPPLPCCLQRGAAAHSADGVDHVSTAVRLQGGSLPGRLSHLGWLGWHERKQQLQVAPWPAEVWPACWRSSCLTGCCSPHTVPDVQMDAAGLH